uniref:Uncharacterized protein LOC101489768 n=1 Tax=Cicer arietinum TaxID=3827 RepID=A0A1S3EBJ9_CICAR|nr:uncharacterized protein LOC101489768 [Cicer arietinum]
MEDDYPGLWYLDTRCSNHMSGHKDWFVSIDEKVKRKIRFADNNIVTAKGVGKILIQIRDGKQSFICDVLYVPNMKNNLVCLGQLLEKGYYMNMENRKIKMFDSAKRLMLKAPLSMNRTFKIEIQINENQCLAAEIKREDWLWHQRTLHEVTAPYTPQHNGTIERRNRTIVNMAKSMLKGKKCLVDSGRKQYQLQSSPGIPTRSTSSAIAVELVEDQPADAANQPTFEPVTRSAKARQPLVILQPYEVATYKARLVANGFFQKHGLDYDELQRLVYASAVKSAFLNESLYEEVYVKQTPGYVKTSKEYHVYKLNKALYGLKFEKCVNEHGVYVKKGAATPALLKCLYVDDLLLTSSDEVKIKEFKIRMEKEFEMTDLGMLAYFLGIEFETKKNGIFIHQKRYASDVLKRFKMQECNGSSTPLESGLVLSKEGNNELIDPTTFKQIVESLKYLCNTRPNISYSVGLISRYMEKLMTSHYMAEKKILR